LPHMTRSFSLGQCVGVPLAGDQGRQHLAATFAEQIRDDTRQLNVRVFQHLVDAVFGLCAGLHEGHARAGQIA
jgi:hypothetical protein